MVKWIEKNKIHPHLKPIFYHFAIQILSKITRNFTQIPLQPHIHKPPSIKRTIPPPKRGYNERNSRRITVTKRFHHQTYLPHPNVCKLISPTGQLDVEVDGERHRNKANSNFNNEWDDLEGGWNACSPRLGEDAKNTLGLLVLLYKGVSWLFFTNILYSFNIHIVNFYFIILHSWIEQQLFNMFNICSIYFYTFDSLLLQIKELYRFSHFAQITKNISFSLSLVQFKILKTNTWAIY